MNLWGDVVAQHFDGGVERLDDQQHKGQHQQHQGVQGGPQSIHHTCGCDQQQFASGSLVPRMSTRKPSSELRLAF